MRVLPLLLVAGCISPVFAIPVYVEIDQMSALVQPPQTFVNAPNSDGASKGLEFSSAIEFQGRLLISDDETDAINNPDFVGTDRDGFSLIELKPSSDGKTFTLARPFLKGFAEAGDQLIPFDDMESTTTRGDTLFAMGSHSFNNSGKRRPQREVLMRIRGANPESVRVQVKATELRDRFVDLLLTMPEQKLSKEVIETQLNIEGLSADPASKDLFVGVKRPVVGADGRAVVIRLSDPDAWFDGKATGLEIKVATTLKLGGAGISSLEWDPVLQGYLMASSIKDNTKEFSGSSLWFWRESAADLREICRFQNRALEGICRINAGPHAGNMLLAFDEETFTADWKPKDGGMVAILRWGRR